MRYIFQFFALVSIAVGQTTPSITVITNAALPDLDEHPYGAVRLQPRSMATIFGNNLSTETASTTPPWTTALGGIELHFVPLGVGCGTYSPPTGGCDILASLIYVSPTQINFLVPDISAPVSNQQDLPLDAVIVIGGQRFDTGGLLYTSSIGDFAVFGVGYDCDFSLSLVQPQSCGFSPTPGQYTVPIGAVTDASGNLITSQNPIHQNQIVVLWATGLASLTLNQSTGLRQQNSPTPLTFGISQSATASGSGAFNFNWTTQTPIWAGESPQYVGLDQINVAFPTCNGPLANTEQRYNAAMTFAAHDPSGYPANNYVTLCEPFIISPGEATCQFGQPTTITIVSSADPSIGSQFIDFTVTVTPPANGTVTLLDSQNTIQIQNLSGGNAGFGVYVSPSTGLTPGSHIIQALYNGSNTYQGSSASLTQSVQLPSLTPTTTTLVSSVDPSLAGQQMTFVATVSPCCLPTGSVAFSYGNETLCSYVAMKQGTATCQTSGVYLSNATPGLGVGSYSVVATYSGDQSYAHSSSNSIVQVVQMNHATISFSIGSYRNVNGASETALGEGLWFNVSVGGAHSSLAPSGIVMFFDGATSIGTMPVSAYMTYDTSSLALGAHVLSASDGGDINFSAVTSTSATVNIWTISSFTSSSNPSTAGQKVTFTVCGIPSYVKNGYVRFIVDGSSSDVQIASPCTSYTASGLVTGSHLVTVGLVESSAPGIPRVTFPFSIIQVVD